MGLGFFRCSVGFERVERILMSMHHEFIKTEGNKHEMIFPNKTQPRKNYAYQAFRKITEESKAWKENIYIIHKRQ